MIDRCYDDINRSVTYTMLFDEGQLNNVMRTLQ